MAGLEFVGVTAFGGNACSMRIRADGAFEYSRPGVFKVTNKPVDLYATGGYNHFVLSGEHNLIAQLFTSNSTVLTDSPLFMIQVDLRQSALKYQVSYGEDICKLNIQ